MLSERLVTEYGGTFSTSNNQDGGHFGQENET